MARKNNKRPVYLDLLRIRLPVGGVVSILHRVTGVLLVLALPFALSALQQSLSGPETFDRLAQALRPLPARLGLALALLVLAHHFLAGVRHLLLDLDIGISRDGSRRGAWLVLAGVALIALVGGGRLL